MPLPKITLDRIKADAEREIGEQNNVLALNETYMEGFEEGYITGATAENEQAQKLADVMEATIGILSAFIQPAYFNKLISTEQQILINTRREIENVLEEWKGTITPDQAATLLHPPDDNSPKGMAGPPVDPFTVKKEVGDE